MAKGVKTFTAPPRAAGRARRSCSSTGPARRSRASSAGSCCRSTRRADIIPFDTANDVLGGTFLSRLNMDLREDKGWSYGVSGNENVMLHAVPYMISAPVQADRTGDSLVELNKQINEFLTTKGVTQEELERTVQNDINSLPGSFETSGAVLGAMMNIDMLGRPDNYYETLAPEYRAQTTASLDKAARSLLDPKGFTWIVVGDAAKVRPQLEKLGMPIEVVEAP